MREWLTILHCRPKTEAEFLVVSQLGDGVSEENYLVENESHVTVPCLMEESRVSKFNVPTYEMSIRRK
jgi:hypothetical protein